jgi:phosphatidylethanolamine/phosphatidyl-N-methylethanolamine N-methyltransferase
MSFISQFIRSPRSVGAITPSSPALACTLTDLVRGPLKGIVLELGAGTGSVSKHIADKLADSKRLHCVEMNPSMCKKFRKNHPDLLLHEMDCQSMSERFGDYKISNIICCLPFRSMPSAVVDRIFKEIVSVSCSDTLLSLFTYDPFFSRYHKKYPLDRIDSKMVIANVPPAKVYHYRIKERAN